MDLKTRPPASTCPAFAFLAGAVIWTWAFWFSIALLRQTVRSPVGLVLYLLGGLGPTLSALVSARVFEKTVSAQAFWSRLFDIRRVALRWILVIFLIPVSLNTVAILATSACHGTFAGLVAWAPGASVSTIGVLSLFAKKLVLGPIPEEIGWRGYAIDRLEPRCGLLTSSVIVWVAWVLWHVPLYFIAGTTQQQNGIGSTSFLLFCLGLLPESVLFAWIYMRTGRSILAAIMFHFAINLTSDVFLHLTPESDAFRVIWTYLAAIAVLVGTRNAGAR
jgi:membrane protease YdiL (CAAX protease family)